jgi:hypothetical protein
VTAVAGLTTGITASGLVGFAAAAVMWTFIPARPRLIRLWPRRARGPETYEPR